MYHHSEFDRAFVIDRAERFRDQVNRRISGALTEEEFRPLRLMNGVYLQLHAYMLRIAIPYGTISPDQMRRLAHIADRWDKGYGHFTTRQNIQFNWPKLVDIPDMLDSLAEVGMHAIQTSGNTIRNVTADHFSGAAADEIADPRPYAELIRQWSTDHPEFQFLPRKFKIAVSGSPNDRAVVKSHDIGLRMVRRDDQIGFEVSVGGGLGRTPLVGKVVNEFVPTTDLLPYLEAILSAYNTVGRRDNKYKARLKIAVQELGIDHIRELVEARFAETRPMFDGSDQAVLAEIAKQFAQPELVEGRSTAAYDAARDADPVFRSWADTNLHDHKNPDYAIVTVSTKKHGATPGDATSDQMRLLADIAEEYGQGDLRISHEQNVVMPHIHRADLPAIHAKLREAGLGTANIGLVSDIIACPGLDYCALATARSIPIAQQIATRFDELKLEHEIGELKIKISGCINACGHHHVGHIGILGLDRAGVENYQVTLGGDGTETMSVGERAGPGFSKDEIIPAIERLVQGYLAIREDEDETFLQAYRRLGPAPFKAALYPAEEKAA
ncbi:sulfite reductase (NADPH) hemoprotein beta-component [Paracoccus isoporae]|uniref:Sulfite reductase (NADPH) hemoprotein beta-component n=1 Tax=Paracoccus isoporae TaxID=591205 RepID=A0A1G6UV50_9RHOB|nr:nitrite/sulfite reductase [Paracoccus isoporae]SDD44445.1 sulfite reductase (NADPH) hemoprotein beta-component [Paracoccus isoporae]